MVGERRPVEDQAGGQSDGRAKWQVFTWKPAYTNAVSWCMASTGRTIFVDGGMTDYPDFAHGR
jgi:hypothetical protein